MPPPVRTHGVPLASWATPTSSSRGGLPMSPSCCSYISPEFCATSEEWESTGVFIREPLIRGSVAKKVLAKKVLSWYSTHTPGPRTGPKQARSWAGPLPRASPVGGATRTRMKFMCQPSGRRQSAGTGHLLYAYSRASATPPASTKYVVGQAWRLA